MRVKSCDAPINAIDFGLNKGEKSVAVMVDWILGKGMSPFIHDPTSPAQVPGRKFPEIEQNGYAGLLRR